MPDVYELAGDGRYRRVLSSPRPPSFGLSPHEAIILNSVPWTLLRHGVAPLPVVKEKKKKRRDTPERDVDQKKCRSIYIIINRKENLFNPAGEELVISLELI